MAGDPLRYLNPGDPIPAATLNRLIEASRQGASFQPPIPTITTRPAAVTCIYKNNTGVDIERFNVVGIDGVQINKTDNELEFKSGPMFDGVEPAQPDHEGKFLIAQTDTPDGAVGVGIWAGITAAKLTITHADDQWADIDDTEVGYLRTRPWGSARILYKESGTGADKWGIVALNTGVEFLLWGKLVSSLSRNGSSTFTIHAGDAGMGASLTSTLPIVDGGFIPATVTIPGTSGKVLARKLVGEENARLVGFDCDSV